ncbi:MAG TPA: transketolase C-terminal domain-containing protein, partial [candidate division Zixibacteria bacterium]|nr:transketolase C-terminal domain-containing protein [candidate division Zixibacteria bacterium]
LIFSDYMRGSVRLSAIMDLPVIYIYTHDSIGLGEDGPTHQPIEQLMSLRAMPRIVVMRPGDANEVAECWRVIMKINDRPAALVLSRQALPTLDRTKYASADGVRRGAYILADCQGTPEVILIATGSEVSLCVEAYETLCASGVKARVVSMPSWELFEQQDRAYHEQVLPPTVRKRISVEAGTDLGWAQYVGHDGISISRSDFGASAPAKELFKEFGFNADAIVEHARKLLGK